MESVASATDDVVYGETLDAATGSGHGKWPYGKDVQGVIELMLFRDQVCAKVHHVHHVAALHTRHAGSDQHVQGRLRGRLAQEDTMPEEPAETQLGVPPGWPICADKQPVGFGNA